MAYSLRLLLVLLYHFALCWSADVQDAWDLSYLKVGAAIGDSYTAGIGAGNRIDWGCSRYDGSYPYLVMLQLGSEPKDIHFGFPACSGAKLPEIKQQAINLSRKDYQFMIISAGGNDADLSGILNACVFNFYVRYHNPKCESKLDESQATIKSKQFSDSVDDLINSAKTKLAGDGNIYYVGYAKFFDTTDKGCDKVAWKFWERTSLAEYLTQQRRQRMNDLVDMMNAELRAAVERAGSKVHFIDYDHYVEITHGRYCQPGDDESNGNSANREDLFFYEMKTRDAPWITADPDMHRELRRRNNSINDDGDIEPKNGTLNAVIGALIQQTIEENPLVVVDDETVDPAVEKTFGLSAFPFGAHGLNANSPDVVEAADQNKKTQDFRSKFKSGTNHSNAALGSKIAISNGQVSSIGRTTLTKSMRFSNRTLSNQTFSNHTFGDQTTSNRMGTVVANQTHVLFSHGPVSRGSVLNMRYVIPDSWSRIFHPTQGGHSVIANIILYQMAVDNAKRLGIKDFTPFEVDSLGSEVPALGGAACNMDSTDTWTDRDAMNAAAKQFCADPHNLKGKKDVITSGVFDEKTLDYMNVSIAWQEDANLGQHSCEAWLGVVTDGCDVPHDGQNIDNLKHGGTVGYQSNTVNATLTVEPLVIRRMWDKGKADDHQCNDAGNSNYLAQATLENNLNRYCLESASHGIANSGSNFKFTFNPKTPSEVELATEWPGGVRNFQIFQEECQYYMGVLSNGCSLPGDDNPMNWKHGGSMKDNNGVQYTISPQGKRHAPPKEILGTCQADRDWSDLGWDLEIQGTGWSEDDFGQKLADELNGCAWIGGLNDFTFAYTPEDGQWEWHAVGHLPATISSGCVGRAVASAGGPSAYC